MARRDCPGCRERDALIAELRQQVTDLQRRVADLEARLGQNATNSSLPPSANPPQAPPPVVKQPTGRPRGAQPGHPPRLRCRLPAARVRRTIRYLPSHCQHCQAVLPRSPGPGDPESSWHQVAELPEIRAWVTEYQGHARSCPRCGTVTRAAIPAVVRAHSLGPKLAATLTYLSGRLHLSKRAVEEVAEAVFDVPIALGTVSRLEQEMSAALGPAYAEAAEAVRAAPVKQVDETGWKLAGRLCWLWAAVSGTVALFAVHARRGATGLRTLLGEVVGVVGSDRWSAYQRIAVAQRQLCWAHLRRDFQAMIDRHNAGSKIGENLLLLSDLLFNAWHRVRDGTLTRRSFVRRAEQWYRPDVQATLKQGAACACVKTAAVCREVLALEPALWTFVRVEGVEPTTNAVERALRPAVLWRKRSFGSASENGCRYVERLLTVVQTLRLQGRPVLGYLQAALVAHRNGLPAPNLLPLS